jgi:hypothetical protein
MMPTTTHRLLRVRPAFSCAIGAAPESDDSAPNRRTHPLVIGELSVPTTGFKESVHPRTFRLASYRFHEVMPIEPEKKGNCV